MNLSTTLIAKADVEFCVGVPKQIHVFWTCAVCKLSDDHPVDQQLPPVLDPKVWEQLIFPYTCPPRRAALQIQPFGKIQPLAGLR